MMIGFDEAFRLAQLRERMFRCIEDELRRDGDHKSYEGTLDVTLSFPSLFDRNDAPTWTISWHCYVVGEEGSHRSWKAKTLAEALALAEHELSRLASSYEMARFERDMGMSSDDERNDDGSFVQHLAPTKYSKQAEATAHPFTSASTLEGLPELLDGVANWLENSLLQHECAEYNQLRTRAAAIRAVRETMKEMGQ